MVANGFEWRRANDVTLQDLHKKDLGPHEMCDRVARAVGLAFAGNCLAVASEGVIR